MGSLERDEEPKDATRCELAVIASEVIEPPRRWLAALRSRAAADAVTVCQFVELYATARSLEAETVRQYRIAAAKLEEWAGPVRLIDLDELLVSAWLRFYAESNRPATVRSKRNQILALWRAAADERLCDPPTRRVRTARVPWSPPTAWTAAEVRDLLAAAGRLKRWHPCGLRRSEWWQLAIRIAWDTGLRWGDLVRLTPGDIHGEAVVILQRKTRRPHIARLRPATLTAIRESFEVCPREVVCPWPSSPQTFTAQVRRLVAAAGIRPGTWKWLRRAGASNVEAQRPGAGLAARHLGHAPGSNVAPLHYIDPAIVAASVPAVVPEDLEAVS